MLQFPFNVVDLFVSWVEERNPTVNWFVFCGFGTDKFKILQFGLNPKLNS
ncbi:hypothetical protein CKA32_006363 [Geitlerinema sp. FC II]|nr:hypothetical protein CKA32_006363 [Geitlerinema sp. FC II]